MPVLIACLSTGKGTWTEVAQIIKARPWDRVFLITNQFGWDNFKPAENTKLILISPELEIFQLSEMIKSQLKGQIPDFEVALNLASGTGKEHTALLKAVMELGLNFRLTALKNNQLEIL